MSHCHHTEFDMVSSAEVRAARHAVRDACIAARRAADAPTGLPGDRSNQTPSRLEPCSQSHAANNAHEGKQRAKAARCCAPVSNSRSNMPVWIRRG